MDAVGEWGHGRTLHSINQLSDPNMKRGLDQCLYEKCTQIRHNSHISINEMMHLCKFHRWHSIMKKFKGKKAKVPRKFYVR